MATQPRGEETGDEEARQGHCDRRWTPGGQPPAPMLPDAVIGAAQDPLDLAQSGARHPSSARREHVPEELSCPACGSTPTTPADAPEAVQRVVALARELLRGGSEAKRRRRLDRPATPDRAGLERVARLRDELHATANRVARFGVDRHPIVDPARITAPTDASVLAPEQLLFRLELTAGRLITLLEPLSSRDWARTGYVGDRPVTLGDVVDRVVHGAAHDLLDLVGAIPELAPPRLAVVNDGQSPRDRGVTHIHKYSLVRKASRNAAAL